MARLGSLGRPDPRLIAALTAATIIAVIPPAHAAKDIPIHDVSTIAGETAFLPCNISLPDQNNQGDSVILVLWLREEKEGTTPIYSFDSRDSFPDARLWSNEDVFGKRAFFLSDRAPAELTIEKITEADAGIYRCRVDFRIAKTTFSKVNLTVIETSQVVIKRIPKHTTGIIQPLDVYGFRPYKAVARKVSDAIVFNKEEFSLQTRDNIIKLQSLLYCLISSPRFRDMFKTVPPSAILIKDESNEERKSVVGPYSEGASLHLRCYVYGGNPRPTVEWFRNGKLHVSRVIEDAKDYVVFAIEIHHLSRIDLHSELTCSASNSNRSVPITATVSVDMNFPPISVNILMGDEPLTASKRYDIVCQSSGSRPPATIIWLKNGGRLAGTKETTSNDGNTSTSTLSLNVSKSDAGAVLTCRASNNKLLGSADVEDTRRLQIHYIPEATLVLGHSINPDDIKEDSDVYFDCMVDANPPVDKVEWLHNGRPLGRSSSYNVSGRVIIANQSLVLQRVTKHTAGNYTCVGSNEEGDGTSNAFYLNVMYPPICRPNQERVYGIAKKEMTNVTCSVDANPPDVQFRWAFNNSAEMSMVDRQHISRKGLVSYVTYTPVSDMDYGSLLCYASNKIGSQTVPCVFHIITAGRPDPVNNCSVSNSSLSTFNVWCSAGFNGGLPQTFVIEVRHATTLKLAANLTAWAPTVYVAAATKKGSSPPPPTASTIPPAPRFLVERLESGEDYIVNVFAVNQKGRSEPVELRASTLRAAEKQLLPDKGPSRIAFKLTPITSVLVGAACAVVLVSAIVGVVLRVRCCRRRPTLGPIMDSSTERTDDDTKPGHVSPLAPVLKTAAGDVIVGSGSASVPPNLNVCSEGDEKNPDVIPHPITGDQTSRCIVAAPSPVPPVGEPSLEIAGGRRQQVSTIDSTSTSSPSRTLLQPSQGYPGYCTLRNGIPLHELRHCNSKAQMKSVDMYPTLPRQQWSTYGVRQTTSTHSPYQAPSPAETPSVVIRHNYQTLPRPPTHHHHHHHHLQQPHIVYPHPMHQEEGLNTEIPTLATKRESTV